MKKIISIILSLFRVVENLSSASSYKYNILKYDYSIGKFVVRTVDADGDNRFSLGDLISGRRIVEIIDPENHLKEGDEITLEQLHIMRRQAEEAKCA